MELNYNQTYVIGFIVMFLVGIIILYFNMTTESFNNNLNYEGVPLTFADIKRSMPIIKNDSDGISVPNSYTYIDQLYATDNIIREHIGEKNIDDKTNYSDYSIYRAQSRMDNFTPDKTSPTFTRDKNIFEQSKEF